MCSTISGTTTSQSARGGTSWPMPSRVTSRAPADLRGQRLAVRQREQRVVGAVQDQRRQRRSRPSCADRPRRRRSRSSGWSRSPPRRGVRSTTTREMARTRSSSRPSEPVNGRWSSTIRSTTASRSFQSSVLLVARRWPATRGSGGGRGVGSARSNAAVVAIRVRLSTRSGCWTAMSCAMPAAHRDTDEVGTADAEGVEDAQRVGATGPRRCTSGRRPGSPSTGRCRGCRTGSRGVRRRRSARRTQAPTSPSRRWRRPSAARPGLPRDRSCRRRAARHRPGPSRGTWVHQYQPAPCL